MATSPLLSIGMIFKNEERCIERCLQSLAPLREAVACEVIMADTGAEDGSREIAEKYADEVFDFPWINDFAAARNAVMDRCNGKWYLTIDCDEWLDADISEFVSFLKGRTKADFAFVIQRNYFSLALEKDDAFSDFRAMRLMRMSTGKRYSGTIHEAWSYQEPAKRLLHTVLHHDGYFFLDMQDRKKKLQRNMKLLREALQQEPENLRTLMECIESGGNDPDLPQYIRRAVDVVQQKRDRWQIFGGAIMRYAVGIARTMEMPELDEWITFAQKQFADSVFVRIDVNQILFLYAYEKKEWDEAVRYGEAYREGLQLLRTGQLSEYNEIELAMGGLQTENLPAERKLLAALADAYLHSNQGEKALKILKSLDYKKFGQDMIRNVTVLLCQLHAQTLLDLASTLNNFYREIGKKQSGEIQCAARLAAFDAIAAAAFTKNYQKEEQTQNGYWRPAYTAFRCLADQCEAGRGAAIMMTDDPTEMHKWLLAVEDWQALPIEALEHALQAGVAFPPEEKPLPIEVLDGLASKLTADGNFAKQSTLSLSGNRKYPDFQSLYWTQALALAAMRSFDWTLGKNDVSVSEFFRPVKKKDAEEKSKPIPEEGLALIRRFAQIESAVLPLLYTPQALAEENAALLPPMHRWGLYCSLALEALDSGSPQEYLALLRRGLAACPGEKDMVQFLLDRFLEDARPKANPELLALAEKVRTILAAYSPDDPAVAAIRESPVYKQVAWIIEPEPVTQLKQ